MSTAAHPTKKATGFYAKVLKDSISPDGARLTTMEVQFPRFILAEFNTHRVFSRNSASSRAIPVKNILNQVRQNPFIPKEWGTNKPGMQAGEVLEQAEADIAKYVWLQACEDALELAETLAGIGIHKQIANRLLEPFMWHRAIISATEWSNFFALRDNADAQPEMQMAARAMRKAYDSSIPALVSFGEWHLPLVQANERHLSVKTQRKISAARCARVSYLTHDGRVDIEKDIQLYKRLVRAGHMSPLEHVATPQQLGGLNIPSNFKGWDQLRKFIKNENDFSKRSHPKK